MYDTSWEIKRLYYRQYKPILLYSQHVLYVMANKETILPTKMKRPILLYSQQVLYVMANKEKYELVILISPTFKKDLCYSIYNMYDKSWEIKRLYYR